MPFNKAIGIKQYCVILYLYSQRNELSYRRFTGAYGAVNSAHETLQMYSCLFSANETGKL